MLWKQLQGVLPIEQADFLHRLPVSGPWKADIYEQHVSKYERQHSQRRSNSLVLKNGCIHRKVDYVILCLREELLEQDLHSAVNLVQSRRADRKKCFTPLLFDMIWRFLYISALSVAPKLSKRVATSSAGECQRRHMDTPCKEP
jgi:hypothetical protein